MRPTCDLHCDLPYYLAAQPGRTPLQATSRCSVDQLRAGGVALQVMAIFTLGGGDSVQRGLAQADAFESLLIDYGEHFVQVERGADVAPLVAGGPAERPVGALAAVENASSFCRDDEPLSDGLARLDHLSDRVGPLLYVSLTWKGRNRFGGGDAVTGQGLTDDGRRLLRHLAALGVAVDLSHASDVLAEDILTVIDRERLPLIPLASHSNFRAVAHHGRNLPDELAREIGARGGLIGLNLVRTFVGPDVDALARHLRHGLELGLERSLALGTDFFWEGDLPSSKEPRDPHRFFFPGFGDASCHPELQVRLQTELGLDADALGAIALGNARRFIERSL